MLAEWWSHLFSIRRLLRLEHYLGPDNAQGAVLGVVHPENPYWKHADCMRAEPAWPAAGGRAQGSFFVCPAISVK